MLKEVLMEIKSSRIYSKALIAKNLNVSEEMVDDLTSQLVRMGYIKEDLGSPTCQSKCSGCTVSNCRIVPIKTYSISPKGERLLNN
jgi:predicted transcriptional regulator